MNRTFKVSIKNFHPRGFLSRGEGWGGENHSAVGTTPEKYLFNDDFSDAVRIKQCGSHNALICKLHFTTAQQPPPLRLQVHCAASVSRLHVTSGGGCLSLALKRGCLEANADVFFVANCSSRETSGWTNT